jgi:cystathionine beta-lyase
VLLETPVNPYGTSFNIQAYADKAHSRGAFLIVDSTFGPPGLQDPFAHGADMVMHSGTKYFGGHSDLLCGVLATRRDDWMSQLRVDRCHMGNVMGSMESWLVVRSLRTLEIRVQRQAQNALRLVEFFDKARRAEGAQPGSVEALVQAAVKEITHSSLQTADMEWLSKQMPGGFGPVFSMTLKEEKLAKQLTTKLKFFHHATSLGGVESLIEWRALSDSTVDRRLVRVSVGVENWEDLRDDIIAGLRAVME